MGDQKADTNKFSRVSRGPHQRTYTNNGKTYTLDSRTRRFIIQGRELATESIRKRVKNQTSYNDVYVRGLISELPEKK